jgi:hypothetical protein
LQRLLGVPRNPLRKELWAQATASMTMLQLSSVTVEIVIAEMLIDFSALCNPSGMNSFNIQRNQYKITKQVLPGNALKPFPVERQQKLP